MFTRSELDSEDGLILVRDGHTGVPLAKVYLSWTPDYVIINYLRVEEHSRRRGVASHVLNEIQEENKRPLALGTQESNKVARAFYRAIGFKEVMKVRLDRESIFLIREFKE